MLGRNPDNPQYGFQVRGNVASCRALRSGHSHAAGVTHGRESRLRDRGRI